MRWFDKANKPSQPHDKLLHFGNNQHNPVVMKPSQRYASRFWFSVGNLRQNTEKIGRNGNFQLAISFSFCIFASRKGFAKNQSS